MLIFVSDSTNQFELYHNHTVPTANPANAFVPATGNRHFPTHLPVSTVDGFSFFLSDNNVILCPGDEKGFLPTKYFKKVLDRKSGNNPLITHQFLNIFHWTPPVLSNMCTSLSVLPNETPFSLNELIGEGCLLKDRLWSLIG